MSTFELMSSQFHWLRPYWLLAIIPALILGVALWRQRRNAHQWQQVIAPELLPFLLDGETTRANRWQIWTLIAAWIIATLALAGPTWEKRPTPVEKNEDALVIMLDLSPSMLSEDIKPSRLIRARLKIADILRQREDGLTALLVYAGESHVVTPLTDDTATINSLLTSLHPNIMPLPGSNTESAVELAQRLLTDAGVTHGNLLLITDGVVPQAQKAIKQNLSKNFHLSILGVGSSAPVPIPEANGGFMRDNNRAIVTTELNPAELRDLASATGGRYSTLANSDADIKNLLATPSPFNEKNRKVEREFDNWYDSGHWLVFLLLPVVLYCFRRGALVILLLVPALSLYSPQSSAMTWDDLWLTPDQQAQQTLQNGDAKAAAEQFQTPQWKGSAQYRAGDYAAAAETFAHSDTAQAHYNRGNALAKMGKLDDAIKAYDAALQRDPELQDAATNRQLVEALKKQQEQQKQNQDNKDQDDKNQDKDKQDQQDKNNQDQQNNDQNKQDQDNKDQQDQDKQNQQNQQNKSDQQKGESSSAGDDQNQQSSEQNGQQNSSASNKPEDKNSGKGESSSEANQAGGQGSSSSESSSQNAEQQAAAMQEGDLSDEEKQSMEQWLRRVPDDPGGLLRNKFRYQYQQKRQQRQRNAWPTPENDANTRW